MHACLDPDWLARELEDVSTRIKALPKGHWLRDNIAELLRQVRRRRK